MIFKQMDSVREMNIIDINIVSLFWLAIKT